MKRLLAPALVAALLAVPALAQAGEGCSNAKQETTAAATPGDSAAPATCSASCPHAAAMAASGAQGCGCTRGSAETAQTGERDAVPQPAPPADPAHAVATND